MASASLSTIIVAHDSLAELRLALPPLLAELGPGDELIIVDNASQDGLAGELRRIAPVATLIELDENVGFAAGVNRGVQAARGELVVLLNPDAIVQPGWGAAIREPAGGPWAAWMGLVLLEGGAEINTSGGILHFTGIGWAGQMGAAASAAPATATEVGFASGACLALPRSTWSQVGGFPEPFFMYCEDVDLSLKLRLQGGRVAVIPQARVQHSYHFAKGGLKWRLLERNRWAVVIRTYPGPVLAAALPALLVAEAAVWLVALRGGWGTMKLAASADLVRSLPRLVGERRALQAGRTIGPRAFADGLTAELDSPFLGAVGSSAVIRLALRAYWRAACALLPSR